MRKHIARVGGTGRIDGNVPLVNMTNDAIFVDHESCAISEALLLVENSVIPDNGAFEIAE
jgi:hypothetical protein